MSITPVSKDLDCSSPLHGCLKFTDLPYEIIVLIFSKLGDDLKTKKAASLTSE